MIINFQTKRVPLGAYVLTFESKQSAKVSALDFFSKNRNTRISSISKPIYILSNGGPFLEDRQKIKKDSDKTVMPLNNLIGPFFYCGRKTLACLREDRLLSKTKVYRNKNSEIHLGLPSLQSLDTRVSTLGAIPGIPPYKIYRQIYKAQPHKAPSLFKDKSINSQVYNQYKNQKKFIYSPLSNELISKTKIIGRKTLLKFNKCPKANALVAKALRSLDTKKVLLVSTRGEVKQAQTQNKFLSVNDTKEHRAQQELNRNLSIKKETLVTQKTLKKFNTSYFTPVVENQSDFYKSQAKNLQFNKYILLQDFLNKSLKTKASSLVITKGQIDFENQFSKESTKKVRYFTQSNTLFQNFFVGNLATKVKAFGPSLRSLDTKKVLLVSTLFRHSLDHARRGHEVTIQKKLENFKFFRNFLKSKNGFINPSVDTNKTFLVPKDPKTVALVAKGFSAPNLRPSDILNLKSVTTLGGTHRVPSPLSFFSSTKIWDTSNSSNHFYYYWLIPLVGLVSLNTSTLYKEKYFMKLQMNNRLTALDGITDGALFEKSSQMLRVTRSIFKKEPNVDEQNSISNEAMALHVVYKKKTRAPRKLGRKVLTCLLYNILKGRVYEPFQKKALSSSPFSISLDFNSTQPKYSYIYKRSFEANFVAELKNLNNFFYFFNTTLPLKLQPLINWDAKSLVPSRTSLPSFKESKTTSVGFYTPVKSLKAPSVDMRMSGNPKAVALVANAPTSFFNQKAKFLFSEITHLKFNSTNSFNNEIHKINEHPSVVYKKKGALATKAPALGPSLRSLDTRVSTRGGIPLVSYDPFLILKDSKPSSSEPGLRVIQLVSYKNINRFSNDITGVPAQGSFKNDAPALANKATATVSSPEWLRSSPRSMGTKTKVSHPNSIIDKLMTFNIDPNAFKNLKVLAPSKKFKRPILNVVLIIASLKNGSSLNNLNGGEGTNSKDLVADDSIKVSHNQPKVLKLAFPILTKRINFSLPGSKDTKNHFDVSTWGNLWKGTVGSNWSNKNKKRSTFDTTMLNCFFSDAPSLRGIQSVKNFNRSVDTRVSTRRHTTVCQPWFGKPVSLKRPNSLTLTIKLQRFFKKNLYILIDSLLYNTQNLFELRTGMPLKNLIGPLKKESVSYRPFQGTAIKHNSRDGSLDLIVMPSLRFKGSKFALSYLNQINLSKFNKFKKQNKSLKSKNRTKVPKATMLGTSFFNQPFFDKNIYLEKLFRHSISVMTPNSQKNLKSVDTFVTRSLVGMSYKIEGFQRYLKKSWMPLKNFNSGALATKAPALGPSGMPRKLGPFFFHRSLDTRVSTPLKFIKASLRSLDTSVSTLGAIPGIPRVSIEKKKKNSKYSLVNTLFKQSYSNLLLRYKIMQFQSPNSNLKPSKFQNLVVGTSKEGTSALISKSSISAPALIASPSHVGVKKLNSSNAYGFGLNKLASNLIKADSLISQESEKDAFTLKNMQKKRRKKKLKKETRRRKKRKRFYPRPIMTTFKLYNTLLTQGQSSLYLKNFIGADPNKVHLASSLGWLRPDRHFKNFFKSVPSPRVSTRGPIKLLKGSLNRANTSIFAHPYNNSNLRQNSLGFQNIYWDSFKFTTAKTVVNEFRRLSWKSAWMRSYSTPYLTRINSYLKNFKNKTTKWQSFLTLQGTLSPLLQCDVWEGLYKRHSGRHASVLRPQARQQFTPLLSETNPQTNKYYNSDKSLYTQSNLRYALNKWEMSYKQSEYNRILYQRISYIIFNIKENLTINGQNKLHSFKNGHNWSVQIQNNKIKENLMDDCGSGASELFYSIFKKILTFQAKESNADSSLNLQTTLYKMKFAPLFKENSMAVGKQKNLTNLRLFWGINKTYCHKKNKVSVTSAPSNEVKLITYNKTMETWTKQKLLEQSQTNKTKKLLLICTKKFENLFNNLASLNSIKFNRNMWEGLYKRHPSVLHPNISNRINAELITTSNNKYLKTHLLNMNFDLFNKLKNKEQKLAYFGFFLNQRIQFLESSDQVLSVKKFKKNRNLQSLNTPKIFNNFQNLSHYYFSKAGSVGKQNNIFFNYSTNNTIGALATKAPALGPSLRSLDIRVFFKNFKRRGGIPLVRSFESPSARGAFYAELIILLFHFCAFISLIQFSQIRCVLKTGILLLAKFNSNFLTIFLNNHFYLSTQKLSKASSIAKYTRLSTKATNKMKASALNDQSRTVVTRYTLNLGNRILKKKTNALVVKNSSKTNFIQNLYIQIWLNFKNILFYCYKTSFLINSFTKIDTLAPSKLNRMPLNNLKGGMTGGQVFYFKILNFLFQKIYQSSSYSYTVLYNTFYWTSYFLSSILSSIFVFFEKPAELFGDWLAFAFLLEWSSDLTSTTPALDYSFYLSFSKTIRPFYFVPFLLHNRFLKFFEMFVETLCKPDTDLINRQKKGFLFWDIWADYLIQIAEKSNINIAALATNKEEQNLLLRSLLNSPDIKTGQLGQTHNYDTERVKTLKWSVNQFLKSTGGSSSVASSLQNLFIDIHPPKSLKSCSQIQTSSIFYNNKLGYERSINTKDFVTNSIWGFLPSKNEQPIGALICQVFSGIFYKQISKNLLILGSEGGSANSEKSLLVQAIAGETELKMISDNAHRYAMVHQGVAVGIKLLRDVFDAIALNTPCLFLIEDIHAIGERRPLLISDGATSENTNTGSEREGFPGGLDVGIHEKNQVLYQLSKHTITHYKKPFKGDFSLSIPTNVFSFDLFIRSSSQSNIALHSSPRVDMRVSKDRSLEKKKASVSRPSSQNVSAPILNSNKFKFTRVMKSPLLVQNQSSTNKANKSSVDQVNKTKKFTTNLEIKTNPLLSPPATSPFSVLILKEQTKKFSPTTVVEELPWEGLPAEQLAIMSKSNYSIRVKIALLADLAMSNLSVKLDMITDLLVIIDSVRGNRGFVVFATTHLPFILDPALRRPGRLDETLTLSLTPTIFNKWEFLKSKISIFNCLKNDSIFPNGLSFILYNSLNNQPNQYINTLILNKSLTFQNQLSSRSFSKDQYSTKLLNKPFLAPSALGGLHYKSNSIQEKSTRFINTFLNSKKTNITRSQVSLQKNNLDSRVYGPSVGTLVSDDRKTLLKFNKCLQSLDTRVTTRGEGGVEEPSQASRKYSLHVHKFTVQYLTKKVNMAGESFSYSFINQLLSLDSLKFTNRINKNSKLLNLAQLNIEQSSIEDFINGAIANKAEGLYKSEIFLSLYSSTNLLKQYILKYLIGFVFSNNATFYKKTVNNCVGLTHTNKDRRYGQKNNTHVFAKEMSPSVDTNKTFLVSYDQKNSLSTENSLKKYLKVQIDKKSGPKDLSAYKWWSTGLITALILSFIQKRYIYQKNLIVPHLLSLGANTMSYRLKTAAIDSKELPSPPSSNILLPSKKYENFKRSQFFNFNRPKEDFSIDEKIQNNNQQFLLKDLYAKNVFLSKNSDTSTKVPVFKSPRVDTNKTFLMSNDPGIRERVTVFKNQENSLLIALKKQLSQNIQKINFANTPTSSNWYYRNRIYNRHKNSLIHLWSNNQLPEHNIEATFLSDIDWRSKSFKKTSQFTKKSLISALASKSNSLATGIDDLSILKQTEKQLQILFNKTLNTPDFYKNKTKVGRKTLACLREDTFGTSAKMLASKDKKINDIDCIIDFPDADQYYNPRNKRWFLTYGTWNSWFDFSQTDQIQNSFIAESLAKAYYLIEQNREILDYLFINSINNKNTLSQKEFYLYSYRIARFYKTHF